MWDKKRSSSWIKSLPNSNMSRLNTEPELKEEHGRAQPRWSPLESGCKAVDICSSLLLTKQKLTQMWTGSYAHWSRWKKRQPNGVSHHQKLDYSGLLTWEAHHGSWKPAIKIWEILWRNINICSYERKIIYKKPNTLFPRKQTWGSELREWPTRWISFSEDQRKPMTRTYYTSIDPGQLCSSFKKGGVNVIGIIGSLKKLLLRLWVGNVCMRNGSSFSRISWWTLVLSSMTDAGEFQPVFNYALAKLDT